MTSSNRTSGKSPHQALAHTAKAKLIPLLPPSLRKGLRTPDLIVKTEGSKSLKYAAAKAAGSGASVIVGKAFRSANLDDVAKALTTISADFNLEDTLRAKAVAGTPPGPDFDDGQLVGTPPGPGFGSAPSAGSSKETERTRQPQAPAVREQHIRLFLHGVESGAPQVTGVGISSPTKWVVHPLEKPLSVQWDIEPGPTASGDLTSGPEPD